MRKVYLLIFCFFAFFSSICFAQSQKQTIDRINIWRSDLSCNGMELGQVIRIYKNNAVPILKDCCKKHKSACLDMYSSPDNKTLLYTAIETKAYDVALFLFNLSNNYTRNIDAYGLTIKRTNENDYLYIIETAPDPTSKTPLMLACYNGDLKATKLLLDYGASLLKKNYTKEGKTNKNAYEYAKIAPHKDPGFMPYVEQEYKKQLDLYGQLENKEKAPSALPTQNLTFIKKNRTFYQEQFL